MPRPTSSSPSLRSRIGLVSHATKVVLLGVLGVAGGWFLFASVMDDVLRVDNSPEGLVRSNSARRVLRPIRSIAPLVKPAERPPYREHLDGFNLRTCECRRDWTELSRDTPGVCRCRGVCPSYVTPEWLTAAHGQALCSLESRTGYNCYAQCVNEVADVAWFATPCDDATAPCDPPILAKPGAAVAPAVPEAPEAPEAAEEAEAGGAPEEAGAPADADAREGEEQKGGDAGAENAPGDSDMIRRVKESFDLRGLRCQLKDGKEVCFVEDAQGRELCPSHVTHTYLSEPPDQYLCSAAMADKYYCTVGCQEGNEDIRWGANEIAWCDAPSNRGACPPRPELIPRSEFKLEEWDAPPEPPRACRDVQTAPEDLGVIPDLSMGMLTHEPRSMRDSLATYDEQGLFHLTDEFMIYINKRRPEVEEVIQPYIEKYGSKIKVMGDASNYGIARGMIFLTGNASHPYFLFLERDFQLIEPAACVHEQLTAGIDMLKRKKAHVVRYRHRRHPGRPNWAERMFRGHEDDAITGPQPNLFCNVYYWYERPEARWPDKIWMCNEEPEMVCSDSYYCNWTNNPQLWYIPWWNTEYVERFDSFKRNDPYYDLEMYMNWEPHSWNDRRFIVAQGDGLFKHVDRGNFGM